MHDHDPAPFRRFKRGARRLHEAGKVGDARRRLVGSGIGDVEIVRAVQSIDAWLARQPVAVREFAALRPQPRAVAVRSSRDAS